MINKKLLQELKQKLETEKESLERELKNFAKEDTKPKGDWDTRYPKFNGNSLEEEADEFQEYEKLLSVEYKLELKLRDVNSALEKIKKDKSRPCRVPTESRILDSIGKSSIKSEYGKCEKCGKNIGIERLKVCPEARLCVKCK